MEHEYPKCKCCNETGKRGILIMGGHVCFGCQEKAEKQGAAMILAMKEYRKWKDWKKLKGV